MQVPMEKIITSKGVIDITIPKEPRLDASGETYLICPICNSSRDPKHQNQAKLAVNMKKIPHPWRCNHCGEAGYVIDENYLNRMPIKPQLRNFMHTPLSDNLVIWFWEKRKISKRTLDELDVTMSMEPILQIKVKPGQEEYEGKYVNRKCINFRYKKNGILIDIKYRDENKNFKLISGATRIFYNIDSIKNVKTVIIVEGEMDVLAYHEAGVKNVISVPNGSAISESEIKEFRETGKFRNNLNLQYLDLCIEDFKDKEIIYLATDDDMPGLKLREELARRFGKERCRYIKFSDFKRDDGSPCKDANDILIHKGREALLSTLEYSEPYPIEGVTTASKHWDKMEKIFDEGRLKGFTTGYKSLDPHFRWMPGWLILANGYPGEGKSSMLFNLVLISSVLYGWKWGMYCPENYPPESIIETLVEILVGNTSDIAYNERMSKDRYREAVTNHIDTHFYFVDNEEGYTPKELRIIKKNLIRQYGINGFLTDPWKNLIHDLNGKTLDHYLQEELAAEVRLSVKNNLINLICHHPPTPPRGPDKNYPPPTQYELIGGQVWASTCYSLICIHKHDRITWEDTRTEIHVHRNKEHKLVGFPTDRNDPVMLQFDRRSNRFYERVDPKNRESSFIRFPLDDLNGENPSLFEGF